MSSILRALKKVEDDKSTLRPDDLKIDAEILRSDSSPRRSSTIAILSSLLLLAGGSGATYMFMKRDSGLKPVVAITKLNIKGNSTPPPASPLSDIKTEQLPAAIVVVPSAQQEHVRKETFKRHLPSSQVRTNASLKPQKTVNSATEAASTTAPPVATPLSTTVKFTAKPQLRVNGIAFQKNSIDSMAIINGKPVAAGGIIEGAVVEKILADKVVFQLNGEKFEIQLGQSNR